jgi:hypothetical protein
MNDESAKCLSENCRGRAHVAAGTIGKGPEEQKEPALPFADDFQWGANFDRAAIRQRRYGVIEMIDGRLHSIRFRRWPKWVTLVDVQWLGPRYHRRVPGDRCLIYYNQPLRFPDFLALTYVLSTRQGTLSTFRGGLTVLDEIARIKGSDALLCDAWNARISDRLLARWGWQPHAPSRWHRNYIKRFYRTDPTRFASALEHGQERGGPCSVRLF